MQLSKHFQLKEFTKSQIAARSGFKNLPSAGDIKNLDISQLIFRGIPHKIGKFKIIIFNFWGFFLYCVQTLFHKKSYYKYLRI